MNSDNRQFATSNWPQRRTSGSLEAGHQIAQFIINAGTIYQNSASHSLASPAHTETCFAQPINSITSSSRSLIT